MHKALALVISMVVLAASAIEPPAQPPGTPAPPKPDTAGAEDDAPDPEDADAEEALPPLPPDVAPAGPSPQRFNPTEKVRADFPVSFPIDI